MDEAQMQKPSEGENDEIRSGSPVSVNDGAGEETSFNIPSVLRGEVLGELQILQEENNRTDGGNEEEEVVVDDPLCDDVGPNEGYSLNLGNYPEYIKGNSKRIGEGRQKKLYRFTDPKTGEKRLFFEAKEGHEKALKKEFELLQKLKNAPGFIRVVELIEKNGECFMICEDPGTDPLKEKLDDLSIDQRIKIIKQFAEALSALHEMGFVHGDLFPKQLFLTPAGDLILSDLGDAHDPNEVNGDEGVQLSFQPSIQDERTMERIMMNADFRSLDKRKEFQYDKIAEIEVFARLATWILTGESPQDGVKTTLKDFENILTDEQKKDNPKILQIIACIIKVGERNRTKRYKFMDDFLLDIEKESDEFFSEGKSSIKENLPDETFKLLIEAASSDSGLAEKLRAIEREEAEKTIKILSDLIKKRSDLIIEKRKGSIKKAIGVNSEDMSVTEGDKEILKGLKHPFEAVQIVAVEASCAYVGDGIDRSKILSEEVIIEVRRVLQTSRLTRKPEEWQKIWRSYFWSYLGFRKSEDKNEAKTEIDLFIRALEENKMENKSLPLSAGNVLSKNKHVLTPAHIGKLTELLREGYEKYKEEIDKSTHEEMKKMTRELFLKRRKYGDIDAGTTYEEYIHSRSFDSKTGYEDFLIDIFQVLSNRSWRFMEDKIFLENMMKNDGLRSISGLYMTVLEQLQWIQEDSPYLMKDKNGRYPLLLVMKSVFSIAIDTCKGKASIDEILNFLNIVYCDSRLLRSLPIKTIATLADEENADLDKVLYLFARLSYLDIDIADSYVEISPNFKKDDNERIEKRLKFIENLIQKSEEKIQNLQEMSSTDIGKNETEVEQKNIRSLYRALHKNGYEEFLRKELRESMNKNDEGRMIKILSKLKEMYVSIHLSGEIHAERRFYIMLLEEGLLQEAVDNFKKFLDEDHAYLSKSIQSVTVDFQIFLEKILDVAKKDETLGREKKKFALRKINRGEKIEIKRTRYDGLLSQVHYIFSKFYSMARRSEELKQIGCDFDSLGECDQKTVIKILDSIFTALSQIVSHKNPEKQGWFEKDAKRLLGSVRKSYKKSGKKIFKELCDKYKGL